MVPRYALQTPRSFCKGNKAVTTRVIQEPRSKSSFRLPDAYVAFAVNDIIRRNFTKEHGVDGDQKSFLTNVFQGCFDANHPFGNMHVLVHQHQSCVASE